MTLELVRKKNQPVKTKMQFTKNEWNKVPQEYKETLERFEKHETQRYVYFLVDGDLVNEREENMP